MNKTVILIRHAQSANNALPESQRVSDPGLTELGVLQSERLAQGIADWPIGQLYCSPFKRSLDTTLPISQRLQLAPEIRGDIYEQGGCYSGFEPGELTGQPGMNRGQLQADYPGWRIDPAIGHQGWNAGRDYETDQEVRQRGHAVASWLTHQWQPVSDHKMAALVIHADFKRILMEAMMQVDTWHGIDQPIWNTGISQLHYDGHTWQMKSWNTVDHLPSSMRTPVS